MSYPRAPQSKWNGRNLSTERCYTRSPMLLFYAVSHGIPRALGIVVLAMLSFLFVHVFFKKLHNHLNLTHDYSDVRYHGLDFVNLT